VWVVAVIIVLAARSLRTLDGDGEVAGAQ
jgi:hypothetical protein